jgi:CRP-like cAMP-binding protein
MANTQPNSRLVDMRLERLATAAAHSLAELFDCPPDAGRLLSEETKSLDFAPGTVVFRQREPCKGLYVVVSGNFIREAERLEVLVTLGSAQPGDLVELAAVLGEGRHSHTLTAVTRGSILLLPIKALRKSFEVFPPLRMRLLEELAREVSRGYLACCLIRTTPARRRRNPAPSK